ncbi:MAG: transglycosylase domain-containing protein [Treponema sp.]|jgi:penicillin-binding protein 1C|nr:transglycosylase domain-containing protein [Treponema sp.]
MGIKFRTLIKTAGIIIVSLPALYLTLRLTPYPELKAFLERTISTRVYDRNGILLQIIPVKDGVRREYVSLGELRDGTASVFIAAEDERFYYHFGVDLFSIARAAFQNLSAGRRVSGASTITMQLARIIAADKGGGALGRKIAEAVNALRLETRLTKNEILELYLNSSPFGSQTEGLASAARNFFSAEAGMLTPAQIFCLAVIPRRPSTYNPLQNPVECKNAAKTLQKRFTKSPAHQKRFPAFAAITDEDWDFTVKYAKRFDYPFETPHLIRHILSLAALGPTDFGIKFKKQGALSRPLIKKIAPAAAPELNLSVDIHLQRYIERVIAANVERYGMERLNQGAAIVLENRTGEVLAWVGSAAFMDSDGGQIDGVLALNQPGSSMKPLLYALALERGFEPNTVLADVPVSFGSGEIYIPQNFNNRFNGPALFRQALASSLNIPAVELLYRLGVKNYSDFLLKLGFDSLGGEAGGDAAGLGLALGGAPVSLLELARAFSVFPNDGTLLSVQFLLRHEDDERGENSENKTVPAERVISEDTARVICAFLSDNEARYLAFGRARNFTAGFPLIVKTGTANQYQSIVALAASRRFTAAVWMGNFSGETVIGKTGSSVPAAIARDSLAFLHENSMPPESSASGLEFEEPEGFVKRPVCAVSGLSPTEACTAVLYEYTTPLSPPPPCGWHRIENGRVTTKYPAEYQGWLLASRRGGMVEYGSGELVIVTPRDGFVFFAASSADALSGDAQNVIPVEVNGGRDNELQVFYDGVKRVVNRPFKFFLPLERGNHTLTVLCGGETRNVQFSVE